MKYHVGEKVIVNGYERYEGFIEEVDKDSWLPYFVRIPTANKSYWVAEDSIVPVEPSDDKIPTLDWSLPAPYEPPKESDPVNHPTHYTQGDVECIDAIKAATESLNGYEGFLAGNCMKYIWRFKKKNGKEDLEKAEWYLKKLMEAEDVHD